MKKIKFMPFSFFILLVALGWSYELTAQEIKESYYSWSAPGGQYVDPASFFSLHGYVNAVFASTSPQWNESSFNGVGMPGQVLVPNTNNSSFQNDEALWINSELSSKTSLLMELHLVTSPSGAGAAGPGGLTFVLTEALATWKVHKNYLNVSFGTFWSPFGIQNKDWLGAQNKFSLIPLASGAYVTHYNEKGVRVDGVLLDKDKWGVNYVVGFGNGYNAWDISGYTSWDLNENKSFNGRVSVFPGLADKLELGFSFGTGDLQQGDEEIVLTDIGAFDQTMFAGGVDLQLQIKDFSLRSYLIRSNLKMNKESTTYTKKSIGVLSEVSYRVRMKTLFEAFEPKLRYDYLQQQSNFPEMKNAYFSTISAGVNFKINARFTIAADYNWLIEDVPLNNDRLIIRVSAEF